MPVVVVVVVVPALLAVDGTEIQDGGYEMVVIVGRASAPRGIHQGRSGDGGLDHAGRGGRGGAILLRVKLLRKVRQRLDVLEIYETTEVV